MSGYFGIGIYCYKHTENVGSLFRAAYAFGASFVFTIGRSYKKQASDTPNTIERLPYYSYLDYSDCLEHLPRGCQLVCIENSDGAIPLGEFEHPYKCAYLLGNESNGISAKILSRHPAVIIPTSLCINVANAGSIVLYDRINKIGSNFHRCDQPIG